MATVFLSAFLLFQVQPIVGKVILPWFGGTPAVWVTCMLFFQVMLLAGYSYAHWIASHLSTRQQALVHVSLLVFVLTQLPLTPADFSQPADEGNPIGQIMVVLATSMGLPFFALAATGPLLQSWFSRTLPGKSYYRLYSLSNAGSFLALLSYPFLVEPRLRLERQLSLWSGGAIFFLLLCTACAFGLHALRLHRAPAPDGRVAARADVEVRGGARAIDLLLWVGLAGCGSALLLAVTNQVCQNVAVVPLLWILPLAVYLLSFVLCFDHSRWYARSGFAWALVAILIAFPMMTLWGRGLDVRSQVAFYSVMLFVGCMCCHGELYRIRPKARQLTLFFLMVAAGGALGGLFVSVVAPQIFLVYLELPFTLIAACILVLFARNRDALAARLERTAGRGVLLLGAASLLCLPLAVFTGNTLVESLLRQNGVTVMRRDFYGTLRLTMLDADDPGRAKLRMSHGTTVHGSQFVDPAKRGLATTYYGPESGIELAMRHVRDHVDGEGALRIGAVGLGVGTVSVYATEGDSLHFYEISPSVADLAEEYFTYLDDARSRGADVQIELGDARIVLERELARRGSQRFDLLIVDAFSSDAIPVHLLTQESSELYWKHLAPQGVLAIHVSNEYLDLSPVVQALANDGGKSLRQVDREPNAELGVHPSNWMLLTGNPGFLAAIDAAGAQSVASGPASEPILWTDDYSSLFALLK